jgi:hypothetical protein
MISDRGSFLEDCIGSNHFPWDQVVSNTKMLKRSRSFALPKVYQQLLLHHQGYPFQSENQPCKLQDDKWVLCLRGSSEQDAPQGYRFTKPLRNGMGGLFVADDGTWDEEFLRLLDRVCLRRQLLHPQHRVR